MAIQKITSNVLADGAVSATNLGDNSVTSAKLANNSVGIDQLNLSDGTDGQVLKTNGSGTISFADAGGGGRWTQLASTTLSPSSPVQAVEFTNFRNSAYSEYEVRWSGYSTQASITNEVNLYVQLGYTGVSSGNYMTSDYSILRWWTKPEGTDPDVMVEKSSGEGYFKLSKWYAQWNDSYPASFGKFNFTSEDSMCSWEWNTHAGGRYSSPADRLALHRSMGLGYNWSAPAAPIEKIKFYASGSSNYMNLGTFTLYGLAIT